MVWTRSGELSGVPRSEWSSSPHRRHANGRNVETDCFSATGRGAGKRGGTIFFPSAQTKHGLAKACSNRANTFAPNRKQTSRRGVRSAVCWAGGKTTRAASRPANGKTDGKRSASSANDTRPWRRVPYSVRVDIRGRSAIRSDENVSIAVRSNAFVDYSYVVLTARRAISVRLHSGQHILAVVEQMILET